MNFCSNCGGSVVQKIPKGDDRERYVCETCNNIYYSNPKMVVGCIVEWEDKILMVKRAIDPQYGKWTLPAGYLENGETVMEGAVRETMEEANAKVNQIEPYTLYHIFPISQIYMMFRCRLANLDFSPGKESLSTRLFSEKEIPWDNIAFAVIKKNLIRYFKDRARQYFDFHVDVIHLDHEQLKP